MNMTKIIVCIIMVAPLFYIVYYMWSDKRKRNIIRGKLREFLASKTMTGPEIRQHIQVTYSMWFDLPSFHAMMAEFERKGLVNSEPAYPPRWHEGLQVRIYTLANNQLKG